MRSRRGRHIEHEPIWEPVTWRPSGAWSAVHKLLNSSRLISASVNARAYRTTPSTEVAKFCAFPFALHCALCSQPQPDAKHRHHDEHRPQ